MSIFKVGAKSKIFCNTCQALRPITYRKRDVKTNRGVVSDVLVGVCDKCGMVASIPYPSAKKVPDGVIHQRRAVASRVPSSHLKALKQACIHLGYSSEAAPVLFRYFIQRLAADTTAGARAKALAKAASKQPSDTRLSVKLGNASYNNLIVFERASHLGRANAIRAVLEQIRRDILDVPDTQVIADAKRVLSSVF